MIVINLDIANKWVEKLTKIIGKVNYSFLLKPHDCSEYFVIVSYSIYRDHGVYTVESLEEFIDLIKKMILAEEKRNYKVGQEVWIVNELNAPKKHIIEQIDESSIEKYALNDTEGWYQEEQLYPSLEKLIDSQINYWTSLKNQEKSTREDDMSKTSISFQEQLSEKLQKMSWLPR